MTAKKHPPKFGCAVCGKRQPAERMVYSRWTANHYCINVRLCNQRAALALRKQVQA